MKRLTTLFLTLLVFAALLSGCNTVRGAGEDISAGGSAIQRAAG